MRVKPFNIFMTLMYCWQVKDRLGTSPLLDLSACHRLEVEMLTPTSGFKYLTNFALRFRSRESTLTINIFMVLVRAIKKLHCNNLS
jgi:hypothetical protein